MKTKEWLPFYMAIFIVLVTTSCMDWGEVDPPPGNQVYPRLEQIASFKFDDEKLDLTSFQTFSYDGKETPFIVEDEKLGHVLSVSNGYVRIENPLTTTKVQDGVSLSFWYKQSMLETEVESPDLMGAIFSFQDEENMQRLFFTANGWIHFQGNGMTYEDNNPTSVQTQLISPGVWHYIAMAITVKGYFIYVDGIKRLEKNVTDFDYSQIVDFVASAPYLYIGHGAESRSKNFYVDDLTIYRNTITNREVAVPIVNPSSRELVPVPDPIISMDLKEDWKEQSLLKTGRLKEWGAINGTECGNTLRSLLGANGLNYVCMGGNQAWNWEDNNAGFILDNIVIYDTALTEEQIGILT